MNIFPIEIRKAWGCVSDESRQKILSTLLQKSECAYTELKNALELSKGNLNHHLSELLKAGLISKYFNSDKDKPYDSYYTISPFGRDFIIGSFNSLSPDTQNVTAEQLPLTTPQIYTHTVDLATSKIDTTQLMYTELHGSGTIKIKELMEKRQKHQLSFDDANYPSFADESQSDDDPLSSRRFFLFDTNIVGKFMNKAWKVETTPSRLRNRKGTT